MVSEQEARACKHAFMQPTHPAHWARAVGALMSYAAFFVLLTLGGLVGGSPNRSADMDTATSTHAISAAQVPAKSAVLQATAAD